MRIKEDKPMNKGLTLRGKKKINTKKQKLLFLFIAVGIIFFAWTVKISKGFFQDFSIQLQDRVKSFGIESSTPIRIEGQRVFSNNIGLINGNIAILSDTLFESVAFSGKKISSRMHNFSNPEMKSCGTKALIYNIGGHDYRIESCSRTILQGSLEEKIICGDVANNGTYALITDSSEYLSQMVVFSRDKVEKYKYSFADFYICGVSLQPNGRGVAVCGLSSSNGQIRSVVYVFSLDSKDPICTYKFEDDMLVSINCLSNRSLVAVGEKSSSIIDIHKKDKKDITHESKAIQCMNINKKLGIAYCLALSDKDKMSELMVIGRNGEAKLSLEIDHSFCDIVYDDNKIFGIENERLFIYDILGELKKEIDIGSNSGKIIQVKGSKIFILDNKIIKEIRI